jgi:hypothetical protein|tara:strand:+ start:193 stop:363 length:171 start_codon:yes stop_codon:yes gene_type:complete
MTNKKNDPFGFQKAINPLNQMDEKMLKQLAEIFGDNPNSVYKKAVNSLKPKNKGGQ